MSGPTLSMLPLGLSLLLAGLTEAKDGDPTHVSSYWYDWGYYGAYPRQSYESFGAEAPLFNMLQKDERCDETLTFLEPRGRYVQTPGPVIMDNDGNLVYTETKWGQARDLKVQSYRGKDYITFWKGEDLGSFGYGSYVLLDEKYEVFTEVKVHGDDLKGGDFHEFHITQDDTALMTVYPVVQADMSGLGLESDGWIYDGVFQEIDIETGEKVFEWRASEHYAIDDSREPRYGQGESEDDIYDWYHINSIDKDDKGNFLVSGRFMCAVAYIDHNDGNMLWQLGGANNSFTDLSDGAATNFTWNHHATWYDNETITIFDNGYNGEVKTAEYSRGIMIRLDFDAMTATAIHQYVSPQKILSPSQGSVQELPNGNMLVGWGHTPAFTEFSVDGEVLCDTHFGVIWFSNFGWTKSYRTFKFPWIGKPSDPPNAAMRPSQDTLFVSWNGATEIAKWKLQSSSQEGEEFDSDSGQVKDHDVILKKGFETRIPLPADANEYLRVIALDKNHEELGKTKPVSKYEDTLVPLRKAPSRDWHPEPFHILMGSLTLAFLALLGLRYRRWYLVRQLRDLVWKRTNPRASYKYQPLIA